MRRTALARAAAVVGGSLVLTALVPTAHALAADGSGPAACASLGPAAGYTEFVEGDAQRTADAEGAVAIGGDADFTHGFSLGAKLTDAEAGGLPGGAALIVGGTLRTGSGSVEVEHGDAIYGALQGTLWVNHGSKHPGGPFPLDFGQAFDQLRATSAAWAALPANGTAVAARDGGNTTLTLTGTDPKLNVFTVSSAQLTGAHEIRLDLPAGSSTLVNVTGPAYDQQAAGTSAYFLRNPAGGGWVEEDYTEPNSQLAGIRSGLVWNFPDATAVTKRDGTAWPGTVLAPNAAVHLGSGNVNGEVIAKSLTSAGGAETHHFGFTGCVPATTATTHGSASPSPALPSGSPSAPAAAGGSGGTSGGASGGSASTPAAPQQSGSASGSASSSAAPGTPSGSATAPAPAASGGSGGPGGGLATTGGGNDAGLIAGIGAGIALLGGGVVLVTRRRAASRR